MRDFSTKQLFVFCALGGVVGGIAFPAIHVGFLAYISLIFLMIALDRAESFIRAMQYCYVYFSLFHISGNWWISSFQEKTDPYLMISGFVLDVTHAFFLMPAALVWWRMRKNSKGEISLFAFPLLYTAGEWLHSLSDLSYPWLAFGYTQYEYTRLIQIAEFTGVWGVSFVVVLVNTLLFALVNDWLQTKEKQNWRNMVLRHGVRLVVFLLVIFRVSSLSVWHPENQEQPTSIRAAVVQPNVDPWDKWSGGINDQIALHKRLQDSLNAIEKCDVSVWSETCIPLGLREATNIGVLQGLKNWSDTSNHMLVTGSADFVYYNLGEAPPSARSFRNSPETKWDVFNSAVLIEPHVDSLKIHHKSKLTPFAERLPHADALSFAKQWFEWGVGISGWQKGDGATVLHSSTSPMKLGCIICIESIYPDYCADFARKGANVLAIITNDAWYNGTPGPEQHFAIAQFRAIESRRYLIRCANSGVSGFISPRGEVISRAPVMRTLAMAERVSLVDVQTLYMKWGDWFAALCLVAGLSLFVFSVVTQSKKVRS